MTCTDFPHPAPTTARPDDSILFAALELSKTRRAASAKSWLVATSARDCRAIGGAMVGGV